jgi:hypothetical protein
MFTVDAGAAGGGGSSPTPALSAAAGAEPAWLAGRQPAIVNHKQKLALARKLLVDSDNNYSWVAGQLGINPTTLWRWRKAGKLA